MGALDFINGLSEKASDLLESFRGDQENLKNTVINTKLDAFETKVENYRETESSKKMNELLNPTVAGVETPTAFYNKFEEIYSGEGKERFEIFNRRISLVLESYLEGSLEGYDTSVKTEITVGMQFALMQKLSEVSTDEALDLFSAFSNKDATEDPKEGGKGILTTLFSGFSKSTAFMGLGKNFMNFTSFLNDYKIEIGDGKQLTAGYIPTIMSNNFFDSPNNWHDITTQTKKNFSDIKTQIPFDGLTPTNMDLDKTAELTTIANKPELLNVMNKKVLDALGGANGKGGALNFASDFLASRGKWKTFIGESFGKFAKMVDGTILSKLFLGGKTLSETLSTKTSDSFKVADFVLSLVGFQGGWKGVQSYLDAKNPTNTTNTSTIDTTKLGTGVAVTTDGYLDYIAKQIEKIESSGGNYAAFNEADGTTVTGVSLSQHQFHDSLAQDMFVYMNKENPNLIKKYMPADFISRIPDTLPSDPKVATENNIWRGPSKTKDAAGWAKSDANWRVNHPNYESGFTALMNDNASHILVDKFKKETLKTYITMGKNLGITDPALMVYFCRLCNWGSGTARAYYKESDGTLAGLHKLVQAKRASDQNNPLGKIYNPLYADLQKDEFDQVDLSLVT